MDTLRLTVRTQARTQFYPTADDALGERLLSLLIERLRPLGGAPRRPPRPALFLFSSDVVRIVDLLPLLRAGGDIHRAIAAFAGLDGVEALGLVGVLDRRSRRRALASSGPVERVAACFIEWSDGRWWLGSSGLDAQLSPGEIRVDRAVDRAARPGGLGNWFSRARFQRLAVRFEPVVEEVVH